MLSILGNCIEDIEERAKLEAKRDEDKYLVLVRLSWLSR